jgi:uncharacterized protein YdeI (YjbR/CyaY-like superfamily)
MDAQRLPKVDDYIASRAPFAQPILAHARDIVHAAQPGIEEAIKWSHPAFLWKGKLVAGMAAFKGHATFGFWHGEAVTGRMEVEDTAMGSFGRMTSLADLPPDAELAEMVQKACALIDAGVAPKHMTERQKRPELPVPPALQAALDANPAAKANWDSFAPSHRREYCEWVSEAKREATAATRRRSNGWPRAGSATGSMRTAERTTPESLAFLRALASHASPGSPLFFLLFQRAEI